MTEQFAKLKEILKPDQVLLPGDDGYEDSLKRWSLTCGKRAGVTVLPSTPEDVNAAIKFANSINLPFTVCGGGHSTSGTSSSDGGMVIHLQRMRDVKVDAAAQTVSFGGGCLWEDVDNALWAHGLATPGGTASETGVGGLILGGGYSIITPRHGMSVDNLLAVDVVLADGTITRASAEENPDLFWALRGAGQSFAVATRFTSRAHPQGEVWAGIVAYPLEKSDSVVAAVNELLADPHRDDVVANMGFGYSPPPAFAPMVLVICCFNGPEADAKEFFAPLLKLEPMMNQTSMMPYPMVNTLGNPIMGGGKRYLLGGGNIPLPLDADAIRETTARFYKLVDEASANPDKEDLRRSLILYEGVPYGKIMAVPSDATAFSNRGEYINIGLGMVWLDPNNDTRAREIKREIEALITKHGQAPDQKGTKGIGMYLNSYSDASRMTAERAFGGNAKRLRELKAKYDPQNRFDKLWQLNLQ